MNRTRQRTATAIWILEGLLFLALLMTSLNGCAGGGISQGLARTAAAISGQEVVQGKLGKADGSMKFIAATALDIAHYTLDADGDDGNLYLFRIIDLEIAKEMLGVVKHDRLSFAGVPFEYPKEIEGPYIDEDGKIHMPEAKPETEPIILEVTRLKIR